MNIGITLEGRNLDSVIKTKMPALGIDLGGTKIAYALVKDHKLVSQPRRVPTPHGGEKIIETLIQLIADFQKEHLIHGVGIATAGIVNVDTGEVVGSTGNLPGWEGTPIKNIIERNTMLPVHVENDANAAAYGECRAAGLDQKECIVTITLGTGIGGGIVLKGKLYRGSHWAAGECGHIRIAIDNKRLCTCGLWDCWEAFASGKGFRTTAHNLLSGLTSNQSELASLGDTLTTEDVIAAAGGGDIVAKRVVTVWHEHIVTGLSTLAHTLDPDCIFITGGMSKFVDFELLNELVADRTLPRIGEALTLRPSALGDYAGLVGAGQLLIDSVTAKS